MRSIALFLTRNLVTGGAERVFVNLVNHAQRISPAVALLDRRGALVREIRAGVPFMWRVDGMAPSSPAAAKAYEIPGRTFPRLLRECFWLRNVVERTGAGLVSSFLMRAHVVALLTKVLLAPRLAVVLNVHEHMSGSAPWLYPGRHDRAMMRWIARHLFPRSDRIIVVAEELKRDLVASFDVPAEMIDIVHNPIDVARLQAAAAEPLEESGPSTAARRRIVAVGRLVHLKGYDLLLRAVATLEARRDVELLFVGEGEAREELERLATQLGIRDVVTFAGERENPWQLVARADVLALTSRTEAFPCVLLEAMALGIPVLATDCAGGVRECLRDGDCGVLVPSGDVGAIAAGLERLLGDGELRAAMSAAGLARAESFDVQILQRRYESVLARVMAGA